MTCTTTGLFIFEYESTSDLFEFEYSSKTDSILFDYNSKTDLFLFCIKDSDIVPEGIGYWVIGSTFTIE